MVSPHYIPTKNQNATLISGNRCGHNRLEPRDFIPPNHNKRRPPLLEKSKVHMGGFYKAPLSAYMQSGLLYIPTKVTKRGRYRRKRSEQRAVITLQVGQAIFHTVHLKSMTLGFPTPTGFHYYSMKYYARTLGISYHQVKQAFKAFRDAGYIQLTERYKTLSDGSRRALNPIMTLNPQIFHDLGFSEQEIRDAIYADSKKERESALDVAIAANQKEMAKAKANKAAYKKARRERMKAAKTAESKTIPQPSQPTKPETCTDAVRQHHMAVMRAALGIKKPPS